MTVADLAGEGARGFVTVRLQLLLLVVVVLVLVLVVVLVVVVVLGVAGWVGKKGRSRRGRV